MSSGSLLVVETGVSNKAGLGAGCGVRSQVIGVLKVHRKGRPARKRVGTRSGEAELAGASDELPQELAGIWDYTSLTIPSSATVHFKPGQWTLKLNADATWVMQGPIANANPANRYMRFMAAR
jgi:hypothetical protein